VRGHKWIARRSEFVEIFSTRSTCRCGPLLRMAYTSLEFLTLSLSPANATPSHVSSEGPGGAVVPVSLAPVVGCFSRIAIG
jgi:hypothetical protein